MRFTNLSKMIEMIRDEIVAYKDMPDLRVEATERLRKYYKELKSLIKSFYILFVWNSIDNIGNVPIKCFSILSQTLF